MFLVTEQEGQVKDAELRHEVDDRTAGNDGHVHHAHTDVLQKRALIAELRVRENGNAEFTVAFCFHDFLELQSRDMERILLVDDMGQAKRARIRGAGNRQAHHHTSDN